MSSLEQTSRAFERLSLGLDPLVEGHAKRIGLYTSLSLGLIFIVALVIASIIIVKKRCCIARQQQAPSVTINMNDLESSRSESFFRRGTNQRTTLVPTRGHLPSFRRGDKRRATLILSRTDSL